MYVVCSADVVYVIVSSCCCTVVPCLVQPSRVLTTLLLAKARASSGDRSGIAGTLSPFMDVTSLLPSEYEGHTEIAWAVRDSPVELRLRHAPCPTI